MPTWNRLREEVRARQGKAGGTVYDVIRRERLQWLVDHTGRPAIIYAAEFLHQSDKTRAAGQEIQIELSDKEGFIEGIDELPAGPLDLIMHSPGGNPLAAESIVDLLRSKFTDIRVIGPNIAKSAATMVALSGDVIAMDDRSELGPIDPQMVLLFDRQVVISPAQAIIDQFEDIRQRIQKDPAQLPSWLSMLRLYGPSLLQESQNAIDLSKALVKQWLINYMFKGDPDAVAKAEAISTFFGEHNNFLSHGRMVGISKVRELGVKVQDLRDDSTLRERVWDVYTMIALTFDSTGAFKVIENSLGQAYIRIIQQVQLVATPGHPLPGQPLPRVGGGDTELPQGQGLTNEQQRRLRQLKRSK